MTENSKLTHVGADGSARMVDVSGKQDTVRIAKASARVSMSDQAMQQLLDNTNKKGDVLAVAKIAGIQAAKKCGDLIPLCHPLALDSVDVAFVLNKQENAIEIETCCKLTGKTGVEMEALTAASVAALTIYDMCKAVDKRITIGDIQLFNKQGGKSGDWSR